MDKSQQNGLRSVFVFMCFKEKHMQRTLIWQIVKKSTFKTIVWLMVNAYLKIHLWSSSYWRIILVAMNTQYN